MAANQSSFSGSFEVVQKQASQEWPLLTHLRHPPASHVAAAKLVSNLQYRFSRYDAAPLCAVGNEYRAASDQNYAEPIWQRKPFAQKEHREN